MTDTVTAAMLVIGDEILSGRTKDRNVGHLAERLTEAGIDLKEVRIVADEEPAIVAAVNALRAAYDYIFTSGGIGPTHDDITADAMSVAFGRQCLHNPDVMALLAANYRDRNLPFTEARQRMARMPDGAEPIPNAISVAPGFRVENVHVMAGVPSVFQAMLDTVLPGLRHGAPLLSATVHCPLAEGTIGGPLRAIQAAHPDTIIGSYPKNKDNSFWTELVVRSRDPQALENARAAVEAMVTEIGRTTSF